MAYESNTAGVINMDDKTIYIIKEAIKELDDQMDDLNSQISDLNGIWDDMDSQIDRLKDLIEEE
jgi:peptidoglycan hydrolase CwlO-like protein